MDALDREVKVCKLGWTPEHCEMYRIVGPNMGIMHNQTAAEVRKHLEGLANRGDISYFCEATTPLEQSVWERSTAEGIREWVAGVENDKVVRKQKADARREDAERRRRALVPLHYYSMPYVIPNGLHPALNLAADTNGALNGSVLSLNGAREEFYGKVQASE